MAAGTALRVLDTEKGDTTVVLLHGYLEMIEVWEELAGALQANYRVVAIDLPGMGVSQVQGEVHTMADESYTSHNTNRLDVEGTVKKILTTEYVQNALKGIPNA